MENPGADNIFIAVGSFGKYQIRILSTSLFILFWGFSDYITFSLLFYEPPFNCTISIPVITTCNFSDVAQYSVNHVEKTFNSKCPSEYLNISWQQCSDVEYFSSTIGNTAVTDFNLICDRHIYRAIAQSLMPIGFFFGSICTGQLSDRFGRLRTIVIVGFIKSLFNFVLYFSNNFATFLVGFFFSAACEHGTYLATYVYFVELSGPHSRLLNICIMTVTNVFRDIYVLILYYFLQNWRWLELIFGVCSLSIVLLIWLMDESPIWLISRNRFAEAEIILQKIATANGRTIPQEHLNKYISRCVNEKEVEESAGSMHVFRIFSQPVLRIKWLILCAMWTCISIGFYAVFFSLPDLSSNIYVTTFAFGCLSTFSELATFGAITILGRRICLLFVLLFGGICGICIPFATVSWMNITLSLTATACFSSAFATIYILTSEIFPTPVRNAGLGSCSMICRIGTAIVPYVLLIPRGDIAVFSLSIFVMLFIPFLHETRGRALPQILNEAENIGLHWNFYGIEKLSSSILGRFPRCLPHSFIPRSGSQSTGFSSFQNETGNGQTNRAYQPNLFYPTADVMLEVPPSKPDDDVDASIQL